MGERDKEKEETKRERERERQRERETKREERDRELKGRWDMGILFEPLPLREIISSISRSTNDAKIIVTTSFFSFFFCHVLDKG